MSSRIDAYKIETLVNCFLNSVKNYFVQIILVEQIILKRNQKFPQNKQFVAPLAPRRVIIFYLHSKLKVLNVIMSLA